LLERQSSSGKKGIIKIINISFVYDTITYIRYTRKQNRLENQII